MSEQERRPRDPELLQCQVEIKEICEKIISLKPEGITRISWDVDIDTDAQEVANRMYASSFGDMLLRNEDSLSDPTGGEYHRDLNLYVSEATLGSVSLRAWKWEDDKYRIDPKGPEKPPYKVIKYPGEKDWRHQLDISLHYSNGIQNAQQKLTTSTGSNRAGKVPGFTRDVLASAYRDMGYGGHNQFTRNARDEIEILAFVGLARELFDNRRMTED